MCGIAGCVVAPPDVVKPDWLIAMSTALRHRGPDDAGCLQWTAGGDAASSLPTFEVRPTPAHVGLVHQRLSIIDVSRAGWQPMQTADGRYTLIFNGEIYNFIELRAELERHGHSFKGHSDSEVLLGALTEWGLDAFPRLVGMFAVALFDSHARTLTLARDFFGIKPLYFSRWSGGFAFASEIKALLELPQVSSRVDAPILHDYLRFGRVEHGEETMFADVQQVAPSTALVFSVDQPGAPPTSRTFWSTEIEPRNDGISFDEAAAQLHELFVDSIRLHLRSDVAVGTALSGGIDSSAIVAAVRAIGGAGIDIRAFSYVSSDPVTDEGRWIDIAARAAGAQVHRVTPAAPDLLRDLEHLIRVQDQPFGSTSIYAQYRVFQLAAASGIKVMLDGQGADELMGGYRPYLPVRIASLVRKGKIAAALGLARRASTLPGTDPPHVLLAKAVPGLLPGRARTSLQALRRGGAGQPWLRDSWFATQGVTSTATPLPASTLLATLQRDVASTSLPALLRYEDRNSMAFSIESRVPFLTPALAEFVLSLPEDHLISRAGTSKSVFRAAMRGLVPDLILDRRDKIGFNTPEREWLGSLGGWVDEVFEKADPAAVPAIHLPAAQQEWSEIVAGRRPFGWHVWRCINVVRWSEALAVDMSA